MTEETRDERAGEMLGLARTIIEWMVEKDLGPVEWHTVGLFMVAHSLSCLKNEKHREALIDVTPKRLREALAVHSG